MEKNIKAVFIDAKNRTVTDVIIENSLKAIYEILGVNYIEAATYLPNGDCIYVDEEGMLKDVEYAFTFNDSIPLAGNGLIVGTGAGGDSISATTMAEYIQQKIGFLS